VNSVAAKSLVWRVLVPSGSLKVTLAILPALGIGVAVAYLGGTHTVWWLAMPLLACAGNLLAAIVTNGAFRRQLPLLVFHVALLALILLLAAGRLTYLKGRAEVLEGGIFEGELADMEAGPWHRNHLDQVRFVNDGFSIDYAPGLRRGATRNTLRYAAEDGTQQRAVIGDNQPLVVHGYRFYTSFNKGFAPLFRWHPANAAQASLGAVHLPAYPLHEYAQAQEWTLPGTATQAWVLLQFDEKVIDPDKADRFKMPKDHTVVLRVAEQRWELRPGQSAQLPGGRIEYDSLRTWMGYNVYYDWTLSWLVAACLTAIAALGTHFWVKLSARPWNGQEPAAK
jgi:cytochrome c biogenesis protein ResB